MLGSGVILLHDNCQTLPWWPRWRTISQAASWLLACQDQLLWTLHSLLEEATWQPQVLAAEPQLWLLKALSQPWLLQTACTGLSAITSHYHPAQRGNTFPSNSVEGLWLVQRQSFICMMDCCDWSSVVLHLHDGLLWLEQCGPSFAWWTAVIGAVWSFICMRDCCDWSSVVLHLHEGLLW
jgi:hypothetical protein